MATEPSQHCTASNNAVQNYFTLFKKNYCLCVSSDACIKFANSSIDRGQRVFSIAGSSSAVLQQFLLNNQHN